MKFNKAHPSGPTMLKFKVRPGFVMFRTQDEAMAYRGGGPARAHVKARAWPGEVIELSGAEISALFLNRALGMLEPVDDAAKAVFAGIVPTVANANGPEVTTRAELYKSGGGRLRFGDALEVA